MKMSKKYKRICLAFGLSTALFATVVNAANYTKTLNATYRNIGVTYNGVSKTLSAEPFLVDGSTYVPLRAVSEVMGADVNWNGSTNTVTITNNAGDTTSLQQQLASANYQVTTLQRELETVKAELDTYKNSNNSSNTGSTSGTDITTAELTATEKYLSDTYADYFDDVYFDFDLAKKGSRLQLTLSYSDSSDEKAFNKLRESKVTDMLQDICDDVSARHAEIDIQGTITYTKSSTDKASFSYANKTSRLKVSYGLDADDIKTIVEDTRTKLSVQGFSSDLAIKDVDVSVNNSNSTVTFMLYIDSSDSNFNDTWNANIDINKNFIKNQLKKIADNIYEETDYTITGEVYKYNSSALLANYDYKYDEISLTTAK